MKLNEEKCKEELRRNEKQEGDWGAYMSPGATVIDTVNPFRATVYNEGQQTKYSKTQKNGEVASG